MRTLEASRTQGEFAQMDRAQADETIYRDLVDERLETPLAEYKRWMSLAEKVARANIARHICALANSGGGHIIFGFEDDGSPSEPHPQDLKPYGQDAINGIVERYLQPSVHCGVVMVTATSGKAYPVVRVPSHGAQPVCAKRDGPPDDRGRPAGIQSGVHYIRAPGPKSVPIDNPERWREVIHRCVVAERDGLLSSIGRLFDRPQASKAKPVLSDWVDNALAEWPKMQQGSWAMSPAGNRVALGFRLLSASGNAPAPLSMSGLGEAIRISSYGASDDVKSGLIPFEMRSGSDARPRVAVFDDVEAYAYADTMLSDHRIGELWRVTADGRGVIVQPLPEDSPWLQEAVEGRSSRRWPPGKQLSPRFQVTTVAESLAFVRRFAQNFDDVAECEFLLDYAGLDGRTVDEPKPGVYFSRSYTSAVDSRRTSSRMSIDTLTANMPEAISTLVAPVFRLFDGWDIGPDYVRKILENPR